MKALQILALLCASTSWAQQFSLPADYPIWPDQSRWVATAKAAGYDDATAHAPDFSNKAIWPYTTGKEAYATQKWPQGRVYVWAHPGESSTGERMPDAKHDILDPKSWLENGKTPAKVVFDENTDIVLPASDKRYVVSTVPLGAAQTLRHATVNRGAHLGGGGDGVGRRFFGNVWIKRGGGSYAQARTMFSGEQSSFLRNDNTYDVNIDRKASHQRVSQYIGVDKAASASLEVLGLVDVLDEFSVDGLMIVGPDSRCHPGRLAEPVITQRGTLALLDGAFFGSWTNNFGNTDIKLQGTLQGGLPERPLTRNAYVGIHFKNHTDSQYDGPDAPRRRDQLITTPPVPAISAEDGSTLRSITANPAQARLVITFYGEVGLSDLPADPKKMPVPLVLNQVLQAEQHGQLLAKMPGRYEWLSKLPRGLTLRFGKGVTVDTVAFDHVRTGGLIVAPEDRAKWKNVAFGPNNQVTGEPLFGSSAK